MALWSPKPRSIGTCQPIAAGTRPIINNFAVDGTKVYGISDAGVYRLDIRSRWKQVSTEVPSGIVSSAIINDRLYSIVEQTRNISHVPGLRRTVNNVSST